MLKSGLELGAIALHFLRCRSVEAFSIDDFDQEFHVLIVLRFRSRNKIGRSEPPVLFRIDVNIPSVRAKACDEPTLFIARQAMTLHQRVERCRRDTKKLRVA
jgi:hypothetical protein